MIANTETPTAPATKLKRERVAPVESTSGMEALVAEITALQIEQAGLEGRMKEFIARTERQMADQLRPLQLKAEEIAKRVKARVAKVEVFVTEHRDELLPEKKKSFELPTAEVGFALSNKPKVVLANDSDEWASAAERLEALKWGGPFVRLPDPEVDKEALIAARDTLTAKQLAAAGLRIEQPEKFFVRPKSLVAETAKAS